MASDSCGHLAKVGFSREVESRGVTYSEITGEISHRAALFDHQRRAQLSQLLKKRTSIESMYVGLLLTMQLILAMLPRLSFGLLCRYSGKRRAWLLSKTVQISTILFSSEARRDGVDWQKAGQSGLNF
jgi:hypothetical protein